MSQEFGHSVVAFVVHFIGHFADVCCIDLEFLVTKHSAASFSVK